MELNKMLEKVKYYLLQGAYQGADHVLDGAIVEAESIQSECETLRVRVGEMAAEIERINSVAISKMENTTKPSPRITEQDAREIAESARHNLTVSFQHWFNAYGRALLNKLNEN